MSRKGSRGNQSITIGGSVTGSLIGGSVTGSLIGDNNRDITITTTGETSSASVDDLRAAIALLRAEIGAAAGSKLAETEKVQAELSNFDEEVGVDNPDAEMVGIRWKLVQKLLGPLQHVASIAQLADRILTLTRTLFGGN
ncbi:MAG: hypothetical protein ACRDUV_03380 [Pseudonocardiaceae bacterium]